MEPVNSHFSMIEGAAGCPLTSSPAALPSPSQYIFFCRCDLLAYGMPGLHPKSVVMEIWASAPEGGEGASLGHQVTSPEQNCTPEERGPQQGLPATWLVESAGTAGAARGEFNVGKQMLNS